MFGPHILCFQWVARSAGVIGLPTYTWRLQQQEQLPGVPGFEQQNTITFVFQ
jgi:hypothetical protein